ncbi:hypothetical protein AAG906_028223 [Vitis piasezkii]
MSLSGAAQRWFASIEPSRLHTWEDVAHEFLTQFAFLTLMYLDESWRPPDRGRTSLFLPLLVVGGQRWLDLNSLVHAAFSVEEAIARGLWTDAAPSPDSLLQSMLISLICNISISRFMLNSCALLRLACCHDRRF